MRTHPTRSLAAIILVVLAVSTGCSAHASPASPSPPPGLNLAKIVPANYTLTGQQHVKLLPGTGPDAVVVTSAGQGARSNPVPGGTGDVQVLVYDPAVKRWNLALDAGDTVTALGDTGPQRPLLDQTTTLTRVRAEPVWFAGEPTPDLLIYALDESVNHPTGDAAVIRFRTGTSDVIWRSSMQGMTTPTVSGPSHRQQVHLSADYVTSTDGACCPVRTFHQTLGAVPGGVGITADDRPYLGAWVEQSLTNPAAALVLSVDPGSPADHILNAGDLILGLANTPTPRQQADTVTQVDQLAHVHAGARIQLRVQRASSIRTVPVTLGSTTDNPDTNTEITGAGILGISLDESTFNITEVSNGPGQDAGLAPDDRVLSINGRQILTMDDVRVALWGTADTPITVTFADASGHRLSTQVTPRSVSDTDQVETPAQL